MNKLIIWALFLILLGTFFATRLLAVDVSRTVSIDTLKDVKSDTMFVQRIVETKIIKTWKDTVRLVKIDTVKTVTLDTLSDVKRIPRVKKPIIKGR